MLTHFDATSMREKLALRCADAYEVFMMQAVRPVLEPKIGMFVYYCISICR
jgi:hypothetical protein